MNRITRCLCATLAVIMMLTAAGCAPKGTDTHTDTNTVRETPVTTATPTPMPTPEPTPEPKDEHFLLTFAGDCTLGGSEASYYVGVGFIKTVADNYKYPFENVIGYFENDDFSMVNLEGVLADTSTAVSKKHVFRGPTHLVNILTENSVEAVTLANNHSMDHGQAGYDSTLATLDAAEVSYVQQDNSLIYTTDSGLTVGIYAVNVDHLDVNEITAAIAALDANEEVDVVVLSAHWGIENTFRPNELQQTIGHAAIDAGADIVYGTHPHVLQPIEHYNGGLICYSLGNFTFGGNGDPKDYDTAFIQQEVIRRVDGTVELGELTIIPCSISTNPNQNNFSPIPYEEGSDAYVRAMSKLDGTYTGGNLPWD